MDPLTDIFRTLQVSAAIQCRVEATAPWGLSHCDALSSTPHPRLDACGIVLDETASFAMVSRGNCWLTLDSNSDPINLSAGDCFLVAPGTFYTLRDDPYTRAINFCDAPFSEDHVLRYGGGGTSTTLIAGLIHFGAASLKSIAQLLPELILIRAEQVSSIGLDTIVHLLAAETTEHAPASQVISTRLAEILFIQALRAQISNSQLPRNRGWLSALFHPNIGAALQAFHAAVGDRWTVETLAATAGMSRSAFALRFKQLLGQSPLEYVTNWRMQKAIQLLRNDHRKLADIAHHIGYDSDAAFNKAFKRVVGTTPREYLRRPPPLPIERSSHMTKPTCSESAM